MQNLPRLHMDENLKSGKMFPLSVTQAHYLTKVMRVSALRAEKGARHTEQGRDNGQFLVFNNGKEFYANLAYEEIGNKNVPCALLTVPSDRPDPSNNLTLAFAPIKQARLEEMMSMATQMGVAKLQPVITDRTVAKFINWDRVRKIITEASEQSGRNSVPELSPPQKFIEFLQEIRNQRPEIILIFADERFAHDNKINNSTFNVPISTLLVGPEGGFSSDEFNALDKSGAAGMSLGKTILRAEVAAVAALAKLIDI